MSLGDNIRMTRERSGLSQAALSKRTGLNPSQISNFEAGARAPNVRNLANLACALEVSADELLGIRPLTKHPMTLDDIIGALKALKVRR